MTLRTYLILSGADTQHLFAAFNVRQVSSERIEVLARAICEAELVVRDELPNDTEKPSHYEQTLRRSAKKLSKELLRLPDIKLLAEWQKPNLADFGVLEFRRGVVEYARRLGVMPTEMDARVLRSVLTAVSKGEVLPEPIPSEAFREVTGTSPIKETKRGGGRISYEAIGDLTFYLASIYHELTGRAPGYSSTGETPDGSFRDFADRWARGGPDNFRSIVISERRMIDATRRWKEQRVSFAGGDALDRVPHKRWDEEHALGKRASEPPRTED